MSLQICLLVFIFTINFMVPVYAIYKLNTKVDKQNMIEDKKNKARRFYRLRKKNQKPSFVPPK